MLNKFFKAVENSIPPKWYGGFNRDSVMRYASNIRWMFFGKAFSFGVTFIVGIYIARYLGPSQYGLFSYAISFVGLFAFLASVGIDNIVNREIIEDHANKDDLIGTAFYIKIIGSIVAILSVAIAAFCTTKDMLTFSLILLYALTFIPQAFNILEIYFQTQVLSKKVVVAQVISSSISALLKILCIVLGKDIFWIMAVSLVETSVYALALLFSFRKFGNHIRKWRLKIAVARSLLRDSWPLMIAFVSGSIYLRIDQVMVKNILNNEALGLFSVGVKLSEIWYLIPVILCTALSPAIIHARKSNYTEFLKRLAKIYQALFWLAVAIIVPVMLWSGSLIRALFGRDYVGGTGVLHIYVLSCIPVFLWTALNQFLVSENYGKMLLLQSVSVAVLNVVLNVILIPHSGIKGAAIATVISYSFGLIFYLGFRKTRGQIVLIAKSILGMQHA